MTGETGDLRWPVYLTAAQAAAPVRLRIGYVSAVSILPETSRIEVKVNDTFVGVEAIDAATGLKTVEFTVPAGIARPGYNAIALSVHQQHRVDCSVAATYELWTAIDPKETGLVLAGQARTIADLADLPALLPRADGSMPIHIVLTGKTNPAHVQRLIRATQQIALAGRFLQPAVDFEPGDADAYGLDLVLGTRAALDALPKLAGSLGLSGPVARFVPGETGRPLLVVTGSNDAEVDEAIAQIETSVTPTGTPAGLRAAASFPATKAVGGKTYALADLGLRSTAFSGRLLRRSFNLDLPADFLASDYGRGTFDLAGGYAAGLAHGAQVRLDVNGHSSGVIKMPSPKGDTFNHNQLFLPLSLLRPGLNRIDMFAETPRPEDTTCSAPSDSRFTFLDKTELSMPTLARVERLPDLAGLTNGALPYTRGAARARRPQAGPRNDGGRLVADGACRRLGRRTRSVHVRHQDGSGDRMARRWWSRRRRRWTPRCLLVRGWTRRRSKPPGRISRRRRRKRTPVRSSRAGGSLRPMGRRPAACRVMTTRWRRRPGKIPVSKRSDSAAGSDDILDRWSGVERMGGTWRDRLVAATDAMAAWIDKAKVFRTVDADRIARDTSMILAQSVDSGLGDSVTTIVTAPDAATLRASVACLFDPQVWSKVHGRLASIDASNGYVAAVDSTSLRYVSTGSPFRCRNTRLVVAGWLSAEPYRLRRPCARADGTVIMSGTTLMVRPWRRQEVPNEKAASRRIAAVAVSSRSGLMRRRPIDGRAIRRSRCRPRLSANHRRCARSMAAGRLRFRTHEAWRAYKTRFVTETAAASWIPRMHGISHSEGQGYGMLLAVAASDRADLRRDLGLDPRQPDGPRRRTNRLALGA